MLAAPSNTINLLFLKSHCASNRNLRGLKVFHYNGKISECIGDLIFYKI